MTIWKKKRQGPAAATGRGSPEPALPECPRHTDARDCEELAEALASRTASRVRLEHAVCEHVWAAAVRAMGLHPFERWMSEWEIGEGWRHEAPWPSISTSVALHHLKIAGARTATALFLETGGTRAWCRVQAEWLRAQTEARLSLYRLTGPLRFEDALAGRLVDLAPERVPAGFVAKPGEVVLARPLEWRGESLLLPWDLDGHALTGKAAAQAILSAVRGDPGRIFGAWYGAVGDAVEPLH